MIAVEDLKRLLSYDPSTGIVRWVNPPFTHPQLAGCVAGTLGLSKSGKLYCSVTINGLRYKRSRIAYAFMCGRWPEKQMDHINGDSTDDRWGNLRAATSAENNHNHRHRCGKPIRGIRKHNSGWQARLGQKSLGVFPDEASARAACVLARRLAYGEFNPL
jgi:hypothetical protein